MKAQLKEMLNKVMISVENKDDEALIFTDNYNNRYIFYHEQDCCESVLIEDITGELENLLNSPILVAEERIDEDLTSESSDEYTSVWTFYEFATNKGSVTVRWYGSSNGYYSEDVNFKIILAK